MYSSSRVIGGYWANLDRIPLAPEVRAKVSHAAFGSALVANHLRGLVAEAIVACAIEPEWTWCSADWARWDFERIDGLRLEVKQSAWRQTWAVKGGAHSACRFDIRGRSGSDVETQEKPMSSRAADLYVFAHHFELGSNADHCDPEQWRFFVIAEHWLPQAKTIGLKRVTKLGQPCDFSKLRSVVDKCAADAIARCEVK